MIADGPKVKGKVTQCQQTIIELSDIHKVYSAGNLFLVHWIKSAGPVPFEFPSNVYILLQPILLDYCSKTSELAHVTIYNLFGCEAFFFAHEYNFNASRKSNI